VDSDPTYRTLQTLKTLGKDEPVTFYGKPEQVSYNFTAILDYYKLDPRYAFIVWREPISLDHLLASWTSGRLLLNPTDYPKPELEKVLRRGFNAKEIQSGSQDYPVMIEIEKPSRPTRKQSA
jgi:hypothetical protein